MTDSTRSRRWVLRGAGRVALAIPVLPSLLSAGEARAQGQPRPDKLFVGFMGGYGGCWAEKFFPAMTAPATQPYAGRTIRHQPLTSRAAGTDVEVSEVLRARAADLTPALVGKMNLLQGLDLPFDVNHHSAATFGNFAQGDAETAAPNSDTGVLGRDAEAHPRSTIDQVLAHASSVYPSLTGVVQRSVTVSTFGKLSYWYPGGGEGRALGSGEVFPTMSPQQLWDQLFGGFTAPQAMSRRPAIVDLVREDYRRVRANPRLSKLDRDRLDQHLTRIEEIERRLGVVPTACAKPPRPTASPRPVTGQPDTHAAFYRAFQDVLVAALQCGLTRVVSVLFQAWDTTFGTLSEDPFHQVISHRVDEPDAQREMCASRTRMFREVVVPFARALEDVVEADGSRLLDRTLVYFAQEHGTYSHGQENIPVVTFGSAGGALRTGLHVDYRDLTRELRQHFDSNAVPGRPFAGLTYHQLLGSVLQWFDVPRREWGGPMSGAEPNHGGYGYRAPRLSPRQDTYRDAIEWAVAGEHLPVVSR